MATSNSRGIRAGRAYVELGVSDKLTAGLKAAQARLAAFGAGVQSIGLKTAAVGGAILAPLAGAVQTFSTAGDELEKMATRTGLSVEALSELKYAADLSGSSLQTFEKGIKRMQATVKDAGDGLATASDALQSIGLTFEDLDGLSPEQQFKRIADGIAGIEDPSRRAAIAQEILGRAGTELLPLMADGAKGIEAMQKAARELGLTVSTETAKDAAALNDALGTLWITLRNGVFVVGSALAPAVTKLATASTKAVVSVVEWVKKNKALVVTTAKVGAVVLAAGGAMIALGTSVVGVGAILGGAASIIGVVGTAIGALLSPIGLVSAALIAGGVWFVRYSEVGRRALGWLGDRFGEMRGMAAAAFEGIRDSILAGRLDLAVKVAGAGIEVAWRAAMGGLVGSWLEARTRVLNSMAEWWTGLQSLWSMGVAGLHKIVLRGLVGIENAYDRTTDYVAGKILELTPGVDAEAGKQLLEQQLEYRINERNTELQEDLRKVDAGLKEKLTGYVEDEQRLRDALRQNATADIEAYRQALDEARAELEAAITAARTARESVDVASPALGDRSLADLFDDMGDTLRNKIEVRGTFNASAVQSLRGDAGDDRLREISATVGRMSKDLLRVARAADGKGLTFA